MAALVRTLRVGPASASCSRAVTVGRRKAIVSIVVGVWGAGSDRQAIENETVSKIADVVASSSGSTTSRLRQGLLAAHQLLVDMRAGRADLTVLGAGASVLVVDDETILAQVGPSLAYHRGPTGLDQRPDHSRWLDKSVTSLSDDPVWPPLGLGSELEVHWSHWPADPGTSLLLVPSSAFDGLSGGLAGHVLAESPADMKQALIAALGEETPAIHVVLTPADTKGAPEAGKAGLAQVGKIDDPGDPAVLPERDEVQVVDKQPGVTDQATEVEKRPPVVDEGTAEWDASSWERVDATAPTDASKVAREPPSTKAVPASPAVPAGQAAPPVSATAAFGSQGQGDKSHGRPTPTVAARFAAVRAARTSARVLRSMLPERTQPGAYRRERIRLIAVACVAVPILAIGLALAVRAIAGAPP